jgi:hypothetical protein
MHTPETKIELGVKAFLEYWTIDKVKKPSNSECYTPSSEPFKIYSAESEPPLRNEFEFNSAAPAATCATELQLHGARVVFC